MNQGQTSNKRVWTRECVVVLSLFAVVWWFLYKNSSGPGNWLDDLKYMALAHNPARDPRQLHRYLHIYLQRLFYGLAGHPIAGGNLLWAFTVSGTAALTYASSRLFSERSTPFNGLIAVLFFAAHPLILPFAGAVSVDYTLMFFATGFLFVYLLSFRFERCRVPLCILLGLFFASAFKTKESAVALAPLFWGLGYTSSGRFEARRLAEALAFVLLGSALIQALLVFLDAMYLGDAWFSLRPASWRFQTNHIATNAADRFSHTGHNWFSYLLDSSVFISVVPFLLYLVNAAKYDATRLAPHLRLVWLLPLVFVVFYTCMAVKIAWMSLILVRYYLPLIPIVAVLAAQIGTMAPGSGGTQSLARLSAIFPRLSRTVDTAPCRGFSMIACASALAWGAYWATEFLAVRFAWAAEDSHMLYSSVSYPLAATALVALAAQAKQEWRFPACSLALACVAFLCVPPTVQYCRSIMQGEAPCVRQQSAYGVGQEGDSLRRSRAFAPLEASAPHIHRIDGVKVFVSHAIYGRHGVFARNQYYAAIMFNLYFDATLAMEEIAFWYFGGDVPIEDMLLRDDYDYAYLDRRDWSGLSPEVRAVLIDKYVFHEFRLFEDARVVFLLSKEYTGSPTRPPLRPQVPADTDATTDAGN